MRSGDNVDLGIVHVHKQVLAEIAATVISEMDGVTVSEGTMGQKMRGFFLGRPHPAIEVSVDENNEVTLEIFINVRFGLNITDVARHVQDAVRSAINKTVDIIIRDVNVTIQGIGRPK